MRAEHPTPPLMHFVRGRGHAQNKPVDMILFPTFCPIFAPLLITQKPDACRFYVSEFPHHHRL